MSYTNAAKLQLRFVTRTTMTIMTIISAAKDRNYSSSSLNRTESNFGEGDLEVHRSSQKSTAQFLRSFWLRTICMTILRYRPTTFSFFFLFKLYTFARLKSLVLCKETDPCMPDYRPGYRGSKNKSTISSK